MPATLEELSAALVKADAAGNAADAKVFADAIRALASQKEKDAGPSIDMSVSNRFAKMREDAPPPPQPSVGDRLMDSTAATVNGFVNGLPVIGPLAQTTTDAIGGGLAQLTGGNYNDYVHHQQALREHYAKSAPAASLAGNIGGALAGFGTLGATEAGADALGLTGRLMPRVVKSALSTQAIGTADNIARGERPAEAAMNSFGPSAIAAGLPVAGAGLRAAGRGVASNIVKPLATLANRDNEAAMRVSRAITQDARSGVPQMTAAQEGIAQTAGAPVLNADRFGSAVRSLARTSANVSPEADGIFKSVTEDRFATQGGRAVSFVRRLMNGATDDLALQDNLNTAAQQSNKKAYDAAYNSPAAQKVWNRPLQELTQSDAIQQAIKGVMTRGSNRAAVGGYAAPNNPFHVGSDGVYRIVQKADGSLTTPNLAFWDQVKRNIDGMIGTAKRSGDSELTSDLMGLKTKLTSSLDQAIPEYRRARQGAAAFFGADDAVEAGRKALNSVKQVPEIGRAVAAMTPAERDAFSVGYSSELIDKINATRDRVNVINNVFGSTEARQKVAIALGPHRARELEAYVRTEQILDMLRNATQGNSSTTKQLIAAGILGGGGGLLASQGDFQTGLTAATIAALGRRGLQMAGRHVDDQVMRKVADMLSSGDPAQVQHAIQNASLSQAHLTAMDAVMRALALGARGAAMGGAEMVNSQVPVK